MFFFKILWEVLCSLLVQHQLEIIGNLDQQMQVVPLCCLRMAFLRGNASPHKSKIGKGWQSAVRVEY